MKRNSEGFGEDLGKQGAKKAKLSNVTMSDLPHELITQILVKVPKQNLAEVSEVSTHWLQITRLQDFWKLSCQEKWPAMVVSDTIDYDKDSVSIPTVNFDGKVLINWRVYYNLRERLGILARGTVDLIQESLFERSKPSICTQYAQSDELYTEHITTIVELLAKNSEMAMMEMEPDEMEVLYAQYFNFLLDLLSMWWEQREFVHYMNTLNDMYYFTNNYFQEDFKLCQIRTCRRFVKLWQQLVVTAEDQPVDANEKLSEIIIRFFQDMPQIDNNVKEVFRMFIESKIKFEAKNIGQQQVPKEISKVIKPSLFAPLAKNKDLLCEIVEVASDVYHSTDDWQIQTCAINFACIPKSDVPEYFQNYIGFATVPAGSSNIDVTLAAVAGICQAMSYPVQLSEHVAARLFAVLVRELTIERVNKDMLSTTLVRLLPYIISEFISDSLLDEFMTQVLSPQLLMQTKIAEELDKIGATFKQCLDKYMDLVKKAIFDVAIISTFKPVNLLGCYVKFGYHVKGEGLRQEFQSLVKQIQEDSLPFSVSVMECYLQFGSIWVKFLESEEESDSIFKKLLAAIPERIRNKDLTFDPMYPDVCHNLPESFAELLVGHSSNLTLLSNLLESISFGYHNQNAGSFIVPKEHLKRVTLDSKPVATHPRMVYDVLKQLVMMVTTPNGKYSKYVLDVLHSMLAIHLRILEPHEMKDWCKKLMELLEAVKENSNPEDMMNYLGIVFVQIFIVPHYRESFSELFQMSFQTLLNMKRLVPSGIILHAFECYGVLHASKASLPWTPAEFCQLLILSWPKNTIECGAFKVQSATWFYHGLQEAKILELQAPYLNVYSTFITLYGASNAMQYLWPNSQKIFTRHIKLLRDYAATMVNGSLEMSDIDKIFLRNSLVLLALHATNPLLGNVSILQKVDQSVIEALGVALKDDKFDTGVPELNSYIQSLDVEDVCKLLLVNQTDNKEVYRIIQAIIIQGFIDRRFL